MAFALWGNGFQTASLEGSLSLPLSVLITWMVPVSGRLLSGFKTYPLGAHKIGKEIRAHMVLLSLELSKPDLSHFLIVR